MLVGTLDLRFADTARAYSVLATAAAAAISTAGSLASKVTFRSANYYLVVEKTGFVITNAGRVSSVLTSATAKWAAIGALIAALGTAIAGFIGIIVGRDDARRASNQAGAIYDEVEPLERQWTNEYLRLVGEQTRVTENLTDARTALASARRDQC